MNKHLVLDFIKKYYAHVKWSFVAILVVLPITALFTQFVPWNISKIINLINANQVSEEVWQQLLTMLLTLSLMLIASTLLTLWVMYVLQSKIFAPLGINIRQDLFLQALGQHKIFWSKNTPGEVCSKIENSRRSIAAFSSLGDFLLSFYTSCCTLIIMLVLIAQIYPLLAIIYFCSAIVLLVIFHKVSHNTFKASAQQENMTNKIFGRIVNMISNYFVLKIFSSLNREVQRLEKDYNIVSKSIFKEAWVKTKNHLILDVSLLLFECLMIIYPVVLWAKGEILAGDIVYVLSSVMSLGGMLGNLAGIWMGNRSQLYKLQNNLKMLSETPEITDAPNAKKLKIKDGLIEFKHLNFGYRNGGQVFEDFNLKINAGEKIGIVGMSGGGKTTLLHILQRLVDTPANQVFIDGQDIAQVTQASLHQAISFIPQNTSLFHRTLAENLSYGKFNASHKQVIDAAQKSYVAEFADDLPQGYQTYVGDKGIKLSGGQRQRVGIARAILKDSSILLLDEATSALDSKSEKYIQQSLQKIMKGKTVIAVAHRLSTLKNMDRIVVIENGKIIEEGSPKQLLKNQGKYAKLWNLQS